MSNDPHRGDLPPNADRGKSHWSDCPECYEYHENGHPFADLSDEPPENKDFRHLG